MGWISLMLYTGLLAFLHWTRYGPPYVPQLVGLLLFLSSRNSTSDTEVGISKRF